LDAAPPLDLRSPLLRSQAGRAGTPPPIGLPSRNSTVNHTKDPTRPELLEGVEHADIPSEYREQVRRYFAP
jgi:hypothetical protein